MDGVWDGTPIEMDRACSCGRWYCHGPCESPCACGKPVVDHGRCEGCHAEAKKDRDAMVQRFRAKREREGRMNR